MGKQSKNEKNVLQLRKNMTAHVLPHTCASVFDSSLWLSPFSLSPLSLLIVLVLHTLATDTHTQTDRAGQLSSRLRLYIEYIHPHTLTNTHTQTHTYTLAVLNWTSRRCADLFLFSSTLRFSPVCKFESVVSLFFPPLNVIIVFCFELPFVWLPIVCVDFRCTPYYHYYY